MPNVPTDELTADGSAEGQADSALWLLNLIDELTGDVTPEQWAEIKAASEAARRAECCAEPRSGQQAPPLR